MKILWLDLNSSYAHSSLALPALHAQFPADYPAEWDIVSATINDNPGMVANDVCLRKPDIIASTCWLFNHEQLMHIIGRVKAVIPSCCVILGGPEFLDHNEVFLRQHPYVNCVFRGEGEEMFPKWLSVWNNPEQWQDITGLCFLYNNQYHDNGLARVLAFDQLKNPEESSFFNWDKPFVQLETTRGCFNTCAFCVSGGEKPVRTISLEAIEKRLDLIASKGIQNIRVLDRTFNFNNKRALALLKLFEQYYPKIKFHLEIHPAMLSDELKEVLPTLPEGLLHLEAGIQSLRENVLTMSRRLGTLEKSLEGLRFLCGLPNMVTHADLIAGLPLYSYAELVEDIRELASYNAGEIQLESLKLLPGTVMRKMAPDWGLCYSPLPPYEVLQTPHITSEELQTARRMSRLLDGFYNTEAWQQVTRKLILNEADFLPTFLDHLIAISVIDQPLSLERRGLILYNFCKDYYPDYCQDITIAWIEAGMSLKKVPAERVRTKHQTPPDQWQVVHGKYTESIRLCYLPGEQEDSLDGIWFGYDSESQNPKPIFKAVAKD